jgi:hypothetical protein
MRLVIMGGFDPEEHGGELDELRRRFPGWQIWVSGPTWCARPEPLINAASAEELAERIRTAHSQPPDGSPSLASLRSYRARLKQLREYELAAGETWRQMRAEADQWRRFPLRHRAARMKSAAAREVNTGAADVDPGPA